MWTRRLNRERERKVEPFVGESRKRKVRRALVRRLKPGLPETMGGTLRSGRWDPEDPNHDPGGTIRPKFFWSHRFLRKRQWKYRRAAAADRSRWAVRRKLGIPDPPEYDV